MHFQGRNSDRSSKQRKPITVTKKCLCLIGRAVPRSVVDITEAATFLLLCGNLTVLDPFSGVKVRLYTVSDLIDC